MSCSAHRNAATDGRVFSCVRCHFHGPLVIGVLRGFRAGWSQHEVQVDDTGFGFALHEQMVGDVVVDAGHGDVVAR
jgi:hypothetical protein